MTKYVRLECQSSTEVSCQSCSSVPSRLAVFHSNVMNANAFVKTTATAPKNSAAAHNQECQFLVSNVCITLKVFAVRLDNSRHVPAIGPRICLPPEKLAVLCTLCI